MEKNVEKYVIKGNKNDRINSISSIHINNWNICRQIISKKRNWQKRLFLLYVFINDTIFNNNDDIRNSNSEHLNLN